MPNTNLDIPQVGEFGKHGYTAYIPYGFHVHPVHPYQQSRSLEYSMSNHWNEPQESETSSSSDDVEEEAEAGPSPNRASQHITELEQQSSSSYNASKSDNTYSSSYSDISSRDSSSLLDFDSNQFLSAVGRVALKSSLGTGRINLDQLDWENISHSLLVDDVELTKKKWKEHFPRHKCTRLPHGVVIYCNELKDRAGLCSSDGNQSGTRSSSSRDPAAGVGVSTEPNSNESSGNNGNQNGRNNGNNYSEGSFGRTAKELKRNGSLQLVNSTSATERVRRKRVRRPWSMEEQRSIEKLQLKYGNKWTLIAETMNNGRSATEVKNFWHNKKQKLAMLLLKQQE